ncbi:MAG: SH3 domain-containing protein [Pseudolabrys sp.]
MRIKSTLLSAGAALALSAGAASAAVVTGDVNLRSGPGTAYNVIDTMPAGARVAVLSCSGSWCEVDWGGEQGYASHNFIAGATVEQGYYNPGYTYEYGPGYAYDDYDYGDYGPGIVFGFGGGYYRGRGYHHHHGHHHFAHNGSLGPAITNPAATAMGHPGQMHPGHHFHHATMGAAANGAFAAAPSTQPHNSTAGAGGSMIRGPSAGVGHAMGPHGHHH